MLIPHVTFNKSFPSLPTSLLVNSLCALMINKERAHSCAAQTGGITRSTIPNPNQASGELTFHSVGGPSMSLALVPQYCKARWRHSVPKSKSDSVHCRGDSTERTGLWTVVGQKKLWEIALFTAGLEKEGARASWMMHWLTVIYTLLPTKLVYSVCMCVYIYIYVLYILVMIITDRSTQTRANILTTCLISCWSLLLPLRTPSPVFSPTLLLSEGSGSVKYTNHNISCFALCDPPLVLLSRHSSDNPAPWTLCTHFIKYPTI